ncbi:ABC transporter permease subunit [Paenibacillus macerans]|uniref:ABC transporter permease subunit n=1 Tax=Paenibacillus macerans TaxID=44252 RepID=UPI003D31BC49
MNKALFVSTYRRNLKLFGVFSAIIIFYFLATMGMFTGGGSDPFEAMPEAMRNAFGMQGGMETLTGFMATGFYGATFIMFLMIYCVVVANGLISHLVDRGAMAYFLSTPVSRGRIAATQAAVLVVNLFVISLLTTAAGFALAPVLLKDAELNASAFVQMNLVGFLLFFVISGYAFLFSCLLNDGKQTLAASGLLSVLFYGFQIVANMSGDLDWLRRLTVLSVFEPVKIAAGSYDVLPAALGLGAAGIVMYGAAIWIFSKRNLPL